MLRDVGVSGNLKTQEPTALRKAIQHFARCVGVCSTSSCNGTQKPRTIKVEAVKSVKVPALREFPSLCVCLCGFGNLPVKRCKHQGSFGQTSQNNEGLGQMRPRPAWSVLTNLTVSTLIFYAIIVLLQLQPRSLQSLLHSWVQPGGRGLPRKKRLYNPCAQCPT